MTTLGGKLLHFLTHCFAAPRFAPPIGPDRAARGAVAVDEHAGGDCFPHPVLSGAFLLHADTAAPGEAALSPGKSGGFTPARALDMRTPHTGARA